MAEKKILTEIEKLNSDERFQEIVELIEGLDNKECTPLVVSELAKAYNNLAVYGHDGDFNTDMLNKAVSLLESIEDKVPEKDHLFNFRLGYALFYLGRDSEALDRFNIALESEPDDEDTKYFMDRCRDRVALPFFEKPFAQRIKDGWECFSEGEEELRKLISEKSDSNSISGLCHKLLSPAFADPCFEVGFNGEKYDLILSPEKDKLMLYLLAAFKKQAPDSVIENWNILIGRQPSLSNVQLGFHGKLISPSEVTVKLEQEDGAGYCSVIGYCEQLTPLLNNNRGEALWFLDLLIDMTLGEIVNMRYIDTFDLTDKPFGEDDGVFPLTDLPKIMEERFGDRKDWNDVDNYLENGYGYQREPQEIDGDDYIPPRGDVFAGFSCWMPFVGGYYKCGHWDINKAYREGAAAGFIFYPVGSFEEDEQGKRSDKILDFRDELQQYIEDNANDACSFIGGASGVYNGYLDFIAWDLRAVLDTAKEFLEQKDVVPWAYYQSFRSDVPCVSIKRS